MLEQYYSGYSVETVDNVVTIIPNGALTFVQAWQLAMNMAGWKKG